MGTSSRGLFKVTSWPCLEGCRKPTETPIVVLGDLAPPEYKFIVPDCEAVVSILLAQARIRSNDFVLASYTSREYANV